MYYADVPYDLGRLPAQAFVVSLIILLCLMILGHHVLAWLKPAWRAGLSGPLQLVEFMLPQTARERRLWVVAALTAGICEEILFRGFMIDYLHGSLDITPTWSWVASSILFGTGHAYQGRTQVVATGLFGAAMGLVFFQYESLLVPMIIHMFWDMRLLVWSPKVAVDP